MFGEKISEICSLAAQQNAKDYSVNRQSAFFFAHTLAPASLSSRHCVAEV